MAALTMANPERARPPAQAAGDALAGQVRLTRPEDRDQILRLAVATGVFSDYEIDTVAELIDGYYDDPVASGYNFLSYCAGERVAGYAVWGPRDLADHGYDLYWIATHPDVQGRGVARALMAGVESIVHQRGGGWLWVETSSTPAYAAARRLYQRCGYRLLATLDDFYRDGDALAIYVKRIA